jgi:hypothetical protein
VLPVEKDILYGNQQFGGVQTSRNGSNWLIQGNPMASAAKAGNQP